MELIRITSDNLVAEEIIGLVQSGSAGAVNVFIGTVRSSTRGKTVTQLEFEAYEPMALKEMKKIADLVKNKWPVAAIAIHHRTGILDIGDVPVIIAVSTPHRAEGFAACQYAIDKLKESVPIWKKEVFENGEHWVAAHP
jgi:molybdopterin synthase catalytic subunit